MAASNFSMQCGPSVAPFIVGAAVRARRSPLCPRLVSAPSKSTCRTMSDEAPVCQIHRDENGDLFVLIDGTKIAKRGLPDTAHADTWIMLEPGWIVRDVKGGKAIEVRYEPTRMH